MSDLRLGGLFSGMDTKAVVEQLMQIEQQPITRLAQKKQNYQSERTAWREINTNLSTLESKLYDLKMQNTFTKKTYTTTDADAITATIESTAVKTSYSITVNELAKAHSVASNRQADISTSLGLTGTFTINGKNVVIENTNDSLSGICDAINGTADIGVKASIIDNTLVVTATETGIANQMNFTDNDGVLASIGILDDVGVVKNNLQNPLDALIEINGLTVTHSSNTVTDVISGVTLNLKQKGETATIEIVDDTKATMDTIKEFVDQYNKTYSSINNYMKKNETTGSWGVLAGDSTAIRLQSYLRSNLTDSVSTGNSTDQLAIIGIDTDRYGKLSINETKLEEALKTKPDEVITLFTATSDNNGFDGIASRMDAWLDDILKTDGLIPNRITSYEDIIRNIDKRIEMLEPQLEAKETALYRQFTEMEKALGQMQQQSSWLSNMLSNN